MTRITPRWLCAGMIAAFFLNVALELWTRDCNWGRLTARAIAFAIATRFCWMIAGEYQRRSTIRLAWLLLSASAAVSVVRQIFEADPLAGLVHIHFYRHLTALISVAGLLAGVIEMARAFLKTGLGFSINRRDLLAVVAIFGFLTVILIRHEYLSEAHFPLYSSQGLQLLCQVLIAGAAAVSIVLHRFSVEFGGGKLAVAMRLLVLHIGMRLTLVMTDVTFHAFLYAHPAAYFSAEFTYDTTAWIFALAACYRALMFTQALNQAPPRPEELVAATLPDNWTDEVAAICEDESDWAVEHAAGRD